jgi:hypothetical protein
VSLIKRQRSLSEAVLISFGSTNILSLTGDVVGFAGTFGFDTAELSDPIPTPVPPDFTKVA